MGSLSRDLAKVGSRRGQYRNRIYAECDEGGGGEGDNDGTLQGDEQGGAGVEPVASIISIMYCFIVCTCCIISCIVSVLLHCVVCLHVCMCTRGTEYFYVVNEVAAEWRLFPEGIA